MRTHFRSHWPLATHWWVTDHGPGRQGSPETVLAVEDSVVRMKGAQCRLRTELCPGAVSGSGRLPACRTPAVRKGRRNSSLPQFLGAGEWGHRSTGRHMRCPLGQDVTSGV